MLKSSLSCNSSSIVTEIEVVDGILEADQPNDHALCYLRYLDGLDETRLEDKNALRNIDGLKVEGQVRVI